MAKHRLSVVTYREDDGRYVAQCLEADISSFGGTRAEAEEMITEALELYLEDEPVPAPVSDAAVGTVEVEVADG
ncbi:type II toxin-antitoxin system HicB family antitoxin [Streptomonospora litoralis]|uniref:Type II toxin-antitoxin system HicB family antitoxin n=1 Tax=Streptomonospora litoralis TaxID=2498135 RepID=A0A4P6PWH9_9ACTN|nr:type II toxin-antitoxin system HicB family antitoxin [Streptomonospora litoralis]QBI52433.1 hypothetical protein EKD16_03110 [Streptomonospora litoralis]